MNPKASLVVGILCISFSPIFVKLAGVAPLTSGFYRLAIAWLCIAAYCIKKGGLSIGRKELLTAIIGGVVFASDIAVWNLSLMRISATVSTLLANLAPVWVGLLGYMFLKKLSGRLFWIGTFTAIAGMIVLVGYRHILHLQFNAGILLATLASVFYAIYILITNGVLQKISTLTFMFYNMLAGSIFLLIICLLMGNNVTHFAAPSWLYLLGMGIICQLTGWLTINHALRFLDPGRVSIALLAQTVIACLWAAILLNETLQLNEIIGSIIVLAGITITFLKRDQSNKVVN